MYKGLPSVLSELARGSKRLPAKSRVRGDDMSFVHAWCLLAPDRRTQLAVKSLKQFGNQTGEPCGGLRQSRPFSV